MARESMCFSMYFLTDVFFSEAEVDMEAVYLEASDYTNRAILRVYDCIALVNS